MNTNDAYQQTLDYLYRFVDYSLSRTVRYSPEKFNLGRMRRLVAALDHPEQNYAIIHIAGTKGKGSVAAFSSSTLQAAGYRVGLYISPHLHDYAERIRINGQSIEHEQLISLVEEIKPHIEAIPLLTTFEITTALALLHFARQNVDVAVLEVGLGGRLDATNVVVPDVAVITSLSYDHTYLLGNSLAEIAGEKAGIIKPEKPVVLAPQLDEARTVIQQIAAERQSPLTQVGRDYRYAPLDSSLDGQTMMIWPASEQSKMDTFLEGSRDESWEPIRISLSLLGYHQVENAATAYAALQVFNQVRMPVAVESILQGFSQTQWPGRFEILQRQPPIVIDSAHNRDSARKLRQTLDDYFPGRSVVLVFGASEDKDIHGMFTELMPRVKRVIVTRSYHPRAIDPEILLSMAYQFGRPGKLVDDIPEALDAALDLVVEDQLVLVAGSLFVAAGAREAWFARNGIRLQP